MILKTEKRKGDNMPFTTSKSNDILGSIFTSVTCIGLSTTTPNADGSNFTEPPASSGYERANFGAINTSKSAQIANDSIIFFNEAVNSGYGTVYYFGAFASKTGGTPFFIGRLQNSISVPSGYVPIFRKNQLVIGLDKDVLEDYS